MDCVNHGGTPATSYCQQCGKPLCAACARTLATGQLLCATCTPAWQSYQPPIPPISSGTPNPAVAASLGIIPGVGAMYNGQFVKGLIHVAIFALLISLANTYDVFGLFIAAWFAYQIFEAYQTAKAMRDGLPLPDPLGLNQLADALNPGGRTRAQNSTPPQAAQQPDAGFNAGPAQPFTPFTPYTPTPGPPPPAPTGPWCASRNLPVGAIVLIALGTLFLLGQMDIFRGRIFEFAWPMLLIGLGIWLAVRRMTESQGGPQ